MKAVLLVLSDPESSTRESEYNDWYDNRHIPEVLTLPGYISATRFRSFPELTGIKQRYLALYELDVRDIAHLQQISDDHLQRIVDGRLWRPPDDDRTVRTMFYVEVSPRQVSKLEQSETPSGVFLAFAAPSSPDRDAELNRWYDTEHLPDVLELPGFTAAQRYATTNINMSGEPWITENPYLAIYEHMHTTAASYGAAFGKIRERIAAGTVKMTDAIASNSLTAVYHRISDYIERSDAQTSPCV